MYLAPWFWGQGTFFRSRGPGKMASVYFAFARARLRSLRGHCGDTVGMLRGHCRDTAGLICPRPPIVILPAACHSERSEESCRPAK